MFSRRLILLSTRKSSFFRDINPIYYSTANTAGSTQTGLLLKSVAVGATVGVIYSIYSHYDINQRKSRPKVSPEPMKPKILPTLPNFQAIKKIQNVGKEDDLNIILFQYQSCPFCSKVRAFLDMNGMAYSIVEVDFLMKGAINWSEQKKVPMMLIKINNGYIQLTDSSAIVSILSSYMMDKSQSIEDISNFYPILSYVDNNGEKKNEVLNKYFIMSNETKPISREEILKEQRWRKWCDDILVPIVFVNIFQSVGESSNTMKYFSDSGQWSEIHGAFRTWVMVNFGAVMMWFYSRAAKKKHQISDNARIPLYEAFNQWSTEVSKSKGSFMGGKHPNLSDIEVYALLYFIQGTETFKDVIKNTNIEPWFIAMQDLKVISST